MTDLDRILRPSLKKLEPYNSGMSLAAVQRLHGSGKVAKLASNENPHGPAPEVLAHLADEASRIFLYPESDAASLREAVAGYLSADPGRLIFGNGSEELLSILCRSVIEPGDRVITLYPSFPLHEDYAVLMGGKVERIEVTADLRIDVDALIEAVGRPAKMLVFANPMNPVGAWLAPDDLETVLRATHPETLVVLDEAYFEYAVGADYCGGLEFLAAGRGNWIVLRTFSKAWGLAGLRVGYGVCSSAELRAALDLTRTPFNVNALAQTAAVLALANEAHMTAAADATIAGREKMRVALEDLGFRCAPSRGNFLFFEADRPAAGLAEELLRLGTIVKPWKQAGFERFVRVSIGTESENADFIDRLAQVTAV